MSKNIVLCYDGTGNQYGRNNTNVVKVFECVTRDAQQVAFYDPGVGTFAPAGRTLGRKIGIFLGKAFGAGLQQNIEDGYSYLMERFKSDDRLFIFGFSRGAYIARALAGMLHHFGILQRGCTNLITYASRMYNNRAPLLDPKTCAGFRRTFAAPCKPHFIGIWDSVASLGHIHGKHFYDAKLNADVPHACHAISIDEERAKFPVCLWNEDGRDPTQEIEQVWFAGVHSDVGGYYADRGLSDIAFAWMMDKAAAAGLRLHPHWQQDLRQDCRGALHPSRVGAWKLLGKSRRRIPPGALVHQSVLDRMAAGLGYMPELPADYRVARTASYVPEPLGAESN